MPGSSDVTNLLRDRIETVETRGDETRVMLGKHIAECARTQKTGVILTASVLTWMVAHSPEAAHAAGMIGNLLKMMGLL